MRHIFSPRVLCRCVSHTFGSRTSPRLKLRLKSQTSPKNRVLDPHTMQFYRTQILHQLPQPDHEQPPPTTTGTLHCTIRIVGPSGRTVTTYIMVAVSLLPSRSAYQICLVALMSTYLTSWAILWNYCPLTLLSGSGFSALKL